MGQNNPNQMCSTVVGQFFNTVQFRQSSGFRELSHHSLKQMNLSSIWKTKVVFYWKPAGAELCQAQFKLGLRKDSFKN